MLRRFENRTNWAVGVGLAILALARDASWAAGFAAGLGAALVVYGCACYARGKGRAPALGGLLGGIWIAGMIATTRSGAPLVAGFVGLLALAGVMALLGLALLRDRT